MWAGGRTHSVKVPGAGKGAAELCDAPASLVNGDDISRLRLLLLERLDHFLSQVIYRLHLGRLQCQLSLQFRGVWESALDQPCIGNIGGLGESWQAAYRFGNGSGGRLVDLNFHNLYIA